MAASENSFIYISGIYFAFLFVYGYRNKLKLPKSLTQIKNVIELIHS